MKLKILLFTISILFLQSFLLQLPICYSIEEGQVELFYRSVTVYAPAVAETEGGGFVGVTTTITVTIEKGEGCSGKVFVETEPLTEIDMQGSARMAVSVAGSLTGIDISQYDFFFVVKTSSPVIGGPSAGAIMTVATIAALKGWDLDNETMMTGMINPDGSIGPVGGIKEKIDAAYSVGMKRFLIPKGQMVIYTTVMKTIRSGGWIKIYTERKVINVSDYARENYGIEVIEVEDINDALFYFTGYRFEEPEINGNITTRNYTTSMKPLAEYLLKRAEESYENASKIFNKSKSSIPILPFNNYGAEIENSLKDAKDDLGDAKDAYSKNLFYSSTSKSFQSLINSRFVIYACNFFTSQDKEEFVELILEDARRCLDASEGLTKGKNITGFVSLQCIGAAQKRLFEAKNYLKSAEEDYAKDRYLSALYKIAFSVERCKSVGWWLNISSEFNEERRINETQINEISNKYLDLAKNSVIYSQIILREVGETSDFLNDALKLLEEAEREAKNYPASSLFSSLEAMTKANLAIEMIGGNERERMKRLKERAAIEIEESRDYGIEPILAVSYYEYAETVKEESTKYAIFYYRYSQMIAGTLRYILSPSQERESRFEGIPPINIPPNPLRYMSEIIVYLLWIVMYVVIVILIIMYVVIYAISSNRKFKKDFPPETW